jgi:hypothetical protein
VSARKKAKATPNVHEAVEHIDGAIVDIMDAWSMRDAKPDGECLMSALSSLRAARDHLTPRTGMLANRGES